MADAEGQFKFWDGSDASQGDAARARSGERAGRFESEV